MTKEQAYEKLELPVGTDLQIVRQKFQQMHNDFQVQIDGAFNEAMRKRKEQQLEELKEAFAVLNESTSMDDSASLPWTEKNFDAALPANHPLEQSNRQPDLEQSLGLFGLTANQDPDSIITRIQRHIADLRVQSQAIRIPEAKVLYEQEISKAERAKETITDWLNTIVEKQRLEEEHLRRKTAERHEALPAQEEQHRRMQAEEARRQEENPAIQKSTSSEPKKGKQPRMWIYVLVGLLITIIGYGLFKPTTDTPPAIAEHPAYTSEVAFPDVEEKNFVEAVSILRNYSLLIGDTTYIDDVAIDWVLEARFRGQPIRPGSMVPKQSEIDLVLGNGKRPTHIAVPDLSGLNFDEAKFALMGVGLNIRSISSNLDPLDSPDAEVVDQSPKAGQSVSLGAEINFTLTLERTNTPRIAPVLITPVDELNELASVVSFEYDSSKPTPPSYRALEGISRYMRSEMGHYDLIIHLHEGGTEAYNMQLAQNKGDALRQYLIQQGVAPETLFVIAKGNSEYNWEGDTPRFRLEILNRK